ncbi:MAG: hypothetical protein LC748_17605 [Thermomicrobia bacterium]|nr:hypothetical protein [Thermomicrobia bacterium]
MRARTAQRMATNPAANAARRPAPIVAPAALASAVLFISISITGLVLLITGRVAVVTVTRVCDGRRASG